MQKWKKINGPNFIPQEWKGVILPENRSHLMKNSYLHSLSHYDWNAKLINRTFTTYYPRKAVVFKFRRIVSPRLWQIHRRKELNCKDAKIPWVHRLICSVFSESTCIDTNFFRGIEQICLSKDVLWGQTYPKSDENPIAIMSRWSF